MYNLQQKVHRPLLHPSDANEWTDFKVIYNNPFFYLQSEHGCPCWQELASCVSPVVYQNKWSQNFRWRKGRSDRYSFLWQSTYKVWHKPWTNQWCSYRYQHALFVTSECMGSASYQRWYYTVLPKLQRWDRQLGVLGEYVRRIKGVLVHQTF